MKQNLKILPLLGIVGVLIASGGVHAAMGGKGPGPMMDPDKMQAIYECAKAKGVELPPPPPSAGQGMEGGKGAPPSMTSQNGSTDRGPPPAMSSGTDRAPPQPLTEAQRAIVDACMLANGVTPPSGMGPHGGGQK